jgi:hypothetical protein
MQLTAIAVQKTREVDTHDEWFAVHVKERRGTWQMMSGVELRADEAYRALVALGLMTERAVELIHQAREQFGYRPGN